jgi:hypothetical protein
MNSRIKLLAALTMIVLMAITVRVFAESRELEILGWVENAQLPALGMKLKAKLDSGAETSSLDARIIKKFRKDGRRWVRFAVTDRETGEEFVVVRERTRTIGVVQHDGSRQNRPVVTMTVCIAGQVLETEVSLIDRSAFIYPLLLGRSTLESFALIDPGSTFLGKSDCNSSPDDSEPPGE